MQAFMEDHYKEAFAVGNYIDNLMLYINGEVLPEQTMKARV